jgi:hypothetical protein
MIDIFSNTKYNNIINHQVERRNLREWKRNTPLNATIPNRNRYAANRIDC